MTEEKSNNDKYLDAATTALGKILDEAKVCRSHGLNHAIRVMHHTKKALECAPESFKLTPRTKLAILLAALLHDADDRKFFPEHKNFENARRILKELFNAIEQEEYDSSFEECIIRMIDLVSASKNGCDVPDDAKEFPWLLYPRYGDRLESIGWIGAVRTWEYTTTKSRELFTSETPRAKTLDELKTIASKERFVKYVKDDGNSASMMDHYYDKLLHLADVNNGFGSGNSYLDGTAKKRIYPLYSVCLAFGACGGFTENLLRQYRIMAEKEATS